MKNDAHLSAVPLQSWLRIQREAPPLGARAEALRQALLGCPQVRQAWYLAWQPASRTYAQEDDGPRLPPGMGDPLEASDEALFAAFGEQASLTFDALRRLPCWLAGRLRRAALHHGQALALQLQPGQPGVLLLQVDDAAGLEWLPWLRELLVQMVELASGLARSAPLLSADPQPALLLDAEARLLESNAALQGLLGERALTQVSELLPVNHLPLVRACLEQSRAVESVEAQDGERILIWSFIPDVAERRVLARCREATQEIREQREAARARRLYRLITENTTDLISRHTPDGVFLDATPASWTLLGYWPEELRGMAVDSLLHPQDQAQQAKQAREALEQDGYHTMSYRIRHRDGHYLWFETASRAIRETYTGAVVEVVSVSRDITARIQAEENKRRLEDELAHTTRLITLGELASGIAHEINQPLAAVVNYASASQRYLQGVGGDQAAVDKVAQGLARITEHANHASAVIKRLRAFLRKGQRRMQALDLAEVAREAVRLCNWEAGTAQVAVSDLLPDNLPLVFADRVLLEQVLLNLLRNAIDANRERHPGAPSQVRLEASEADGNLAVRVIDQGPGVSDEQMGKLFTPFYTSKADGLGLGLSMSRSIIEGFGGALEAFPAEGGGLCLECRLPLGRED
ncbi:sensor histidine kinase [Ectopseudomonas oleovorans]|uniref:histidine kinase n=2 Tax=Ectopseudomonas oleovorans TaxID=301 RepID=A0AA42Q751_ECTOL|nr:ATP-binding protein [Pseudomonas oleovorans]MDH1338503.1 PAS domain S-box protein [Pseudomonas oleovorans]MDH1494266.1 PAS domain S-box protein [Pseudomonas oleovorans]WGG20419.1 PAS domain S-box protein [Pseudomonas oleovorans]